MNYSPLDRFLHRLAFCTPSIQFTATDIERRYLGAEYEAAVVETPIFITSLPRAGTTIILETLYKFPSLATHTYRDMPFLMAPVLWARLSRAFRQCAEPTERAHNDGLQIGFDSPEAFEEVIWKAYWPQKYTRTEIQLWTTSDGKEEAREFFIDHMKKIIALRQFDGSLKGRYISKNSANIARLELLRNMFPEAQILVPFRNPLDHASSLWRQHQNFLGVHKKEPFSRRYMADLGHFEFGELHRPIAIPGLNKLIADRNPLNLDYWVAYWIATFEHLLNWSDALILFSYDALCAEPERVLGRICETLGLNDKKVFDQAVPIFKVPARDRDRDRGESLDPALGRRADNVHNALLTHSL